jgi:hypothetical protein
MRLRELGASLGLLVVSLVAIAGPAEDAALRKAAEKLDTSGVVSAIKKGANPNAPSSDRRPVTPLNAVSVGIVMLRGKEAHDRALEIANFLFEHGAKLIL